ncbi:HNH endonuclease [Lysinibacillus halotolerans]|uniref:Putative HNH nuclease YajD n=2 Tax=Lysinibacillus halotolerans TaxID=1368476 RepID=A0A3M8HCT9_9BACI|nr:HNH endonuclease [Lysinibacillus halotolerans]
MKFYKSREWMRLRLQALERDNYECQECKRKGRYRRAQCVHHLKEVKVVPILALTLSNLESLCNSCHNKMHDRYGTIMVQQGKRFVNEEKW